MTEFHEFIRDFKAGHLDAQLGDKMRGLIDSVTRMGKSGKLSLDITLTPKLDGEVLTQIKFKVSAPQRDTLESIMFATPENNLVDCNPNQPELFPSPVRHVSNKPSVVKNL